MASTRLKELRSRKAAAENFNGNNISNIEPRQTRLQTKLINPVASTVQEEKPAKTEVEMPKKKRQGHVRKYSGKTIVIEDETREGQSNVVAPTKPSNSKAKPVPKSTELVETLQMLCWTEDLTPVQKKVHTQREEEYNELIAKLESMVKQNGGETVYKGDTCAAYQYTTSAPAGPAAPAAAAAVPANGEQFSAQPTIAAIPQNNVLVPQGKGAAQPGTYQLVMGARLGVIVGTMTPASPAVVTSVATTIPGTQPVGTVSPQIRPQSQKRGRGRPLGAGIAPTQVIHPNLSPLHTMHQQFGSHAQPSTSTASASSSRAAESTAVGGLAAGVGTATTNAPSAIVDLTSDDGRPPPDSREVVFNKLQGKTFPSLVVVARPHLHMKEASTANDRPMLDTKVKAVLVHTPTKFTEWLIQQGLVRSEQHCSLHPTNKLNLGMYSDVSKFPYSGGYVWISECCPHRFVSVFSGSLFEGATHPPTIILKLIYHWACHTNIQNVVQWVKVDNLYVKGLYTWLRSICTYALQQHLKPMGGPGKKIEVGVISLGTTSQDGSQRQVKVEVLGIFDPELQLVRLRAVEPLADGERHYKRRFSKILEPLRQWVHPESAIHTDLTVDKGTLHLLGFTSVLQNSQSGGNQGIMEYLRKIVPRMFQNTLSLLSRQIIQQFLDELVWREWFGQTAAQAFDNMVKHIAEQTRLSYSESLIVRLNKVAWNPFKNYSLMYQSHSGPKIEPPPGIKRYYGRKRPASTLLPAPALGEPEKVKKVCLAPEQATQLAQSGDTNVNDTMVPLETYYYGCLPGDETNVLAQKVALNVRCCVCKVPYSNNIELLDHLLAHAHNMSTKGANTQCKYCLTSLPNSEELEKHVGNLHPIETRTFGNAHPACILCEQRFSSIYMLGKHMSKEHVPLEMPYQCGTCQYRCSSHRQAIDHFYAKHNGAATLQCPFCLKCTAVWTSGRTMTTNVTFFLAHLQKHQRKSMAKKCYKCALWFIKKDSLKEHQLKAHTSYLGKRDAEPWPLPANYVMVPRSKLYHRPIKPFPTLVPIAAAPEAAPVHKLQLCLPPATQCKECNKYITQPEHFPQKLSCSSCRYVTDCGNAMVIHKNKCRKSPAPALPRFYLSGELFCVCGFASSCGNQMAKHLALCERRTAYPTAEMAQAAASDTHSMLDVLGLVRRNDDGPCQPAHPPDLVNLDVSSENASPEQKTDVPAVDLINEKVSTESEETPTQVDGDDEEAKPDDKSVPKVTTSQIIEIGEVDIIPIVVEKKEEEGEEEAEEEEEEDEKSFPSTEAVPLTEEDLKTDEEPNKDEILDSTDVIEEKPEVEETATDKSEADDQHVKSEVDESNVNVPDEDKLQVDQIEVDKSEGEVGDSVLDQPEVVDSEIDKPEVGSSDVDQLEAERSEVDQLEMERSDVDQFEMDRSDVDQLEAERSDVDQLEAQRSDVDQLEAERSDVDQLEAERSDVDQLEAERSDVDQAEVHNSEVSNSEVEMMEVEKSEADSTVSPDIDTFTPVADTTSAPEVDTTTTEEEATACISTPTVQPSSSSTVQSDEIDMTEEPAANDATEENSEQQQNVDDIVSQETSSIVEPMETNEIQPPVAPLGSN